MKKTLLFITIGSLAGFAYYFFVGCENSCSLTSSSLNTVAYGAFIGFVLGWPISKKEKKQ